MIFDERDIEKIESKEETRKKHKVKDSQISFDLDSTSNQEQIINIPKTKKVAKSKKEYKQNTNDNQVTVLTNDELENVLNSNENVTDEEESTYESTFDKDENGNLLKSLDHVLHDSMIPYSEYVIMDRALPRVEDGLKPVQRRILYAMYEDGFTPDKPYKKCANTVGGVLGRYHPHGDTSVYNALVRLAQTFNMKEVLIDGHGNFGSVDGDGAAAMRYTEARLAPLAIELLKDIEKDTVRWTNNYDDSRLEPEMLPGRFPNLLVNGASGIAVGLATNIPTHNLGECIDGAVAVIDNPNITTEQLMKIIKGPDFPTGGIIMGGGELFQAYDTGKGKIIIRAKTHFEQEKGDKTNIVITEFPYQVNKAQLLQKIVDLREKHREVLGGITDIRDESDRTGIRAVITCKKDVDANKVLNFLFKYTDLQTTFGINMVAIANGKPLLMSLKQILSYYVNYQREVVLRRTKFDLKACEDRAHILQGLLIAIQNIDEVIKIIKTSAGTMEAKQRLMETFALTDVQAQAILDMRLSRLTNLEVTKIEQELAELEKKIKKFKQIVSSTKLQMELVKTEMLEIKQKYGSQRLTEIDEDLVKFEISADQIAKPVKDIVIAYSERNAIKKIPEKSFLISAKSVSSTSTLNEVHSIIFKTQTDKDLLLFTNLGNCYRLKLDDILEARWKDRGSLLTDALLGYSKDEKVLYIVDYKNELPKGELLFVTTTGQVRKTSISDFDIKKQSFSFFKLNENEKLISVQKFEKDKTLLFVTTNGICLNANIDDVPLQSKTASGVKGISLSDDDSVLYASLVKPENEVIVLTDEGYIKKVMTKQIEVLARNRKGVKIITFDKNGKKLILAKVVRSDFEIYAINSHGKVVSIKTDQISSESRTTKGKGIVKPNKTEKIKNAYVYLWN